MLTLPPSRFSVRDGGNYKLLQIQYELHARHDSRSVQIVGLHQEEVLELRGRYRLADVKNQLQDRHQESIRYIP